MPASTNGTGATEGDSRSSAPRRGRIVVAEDDAELRSLLALALEADGYEVLQVEDGAALVRALDATSPFDVVISDVRMPRACGLEAMARYRRNNESTPFVVITAFGSEELHTKALELGATAVFDKPFELDDLRALVRQFTATAT